MLLQRHCRCLRSVEATSPAPRVAIEASHARGIRARFWLFQVDAWRYFSRLNYYADMLLRAPRRAA